MTEWGQAATVCSFEGCGRPRSGRNTLCAGHRSQSRRGPDLRPIREYPRALQAILPGHKVCVECHVEKPLDDFYDGSHRKGYKHPRCKPCFTARSKAAERPARIKLMYNITFEQFQDLKAQQGEACAICRQPFAEGKGRGEHIDHDHSCCPGRSSCGKCVRGVLCHACNTGLGSFGDDLDRLTAAMAYLLQSVNVLDMEESRG